MVNQKKVKDRNPKNQNIEYNEVSESFYIHFDVANHCLSIKDFTEAVNDINTIVESFSALVIANPKFVNVYVCPPEKGSFLAVLTIAVKEIAKGTGIGIGIKYASKEVESFIEELTGYKNGDLGKNSAKLLKILAENFMKKAHKDIPYLVEHICEIDKATKAKADFYNMCSRNKNINGIGFDRTEEFPIKRNGFVMRAVQPNVRPLPEREELKELIIVKSVNTDENLQWEFKDSNTNEAFSANIEDEEFLAKLLNGQCPLKKKAAPDIILALVEFRKKLENGQERKDAYIVKEVYKFNRKVLKTRPKGLRLNRKRKPESDAKQLNVFTDM